jgi:hypothetical protein
MKNKFQKYYADEEKVEEMSLYVHNNFKLIMVKMASEMRRKLDIEPDPANASGYFDLMASLQGRMFNEMVYSLAAICQVLEMKLQDIIPKETLLILFDLMRGENPLNGELRKDVPDDLNGFKEYYLKEIEALREVVEALPK